ncbi:amidase [Westerdykella ornata]|uniref:Amidase n=1 Tax=Westerdykella ornata TaxID=318751 RepID=A0A6A6JF05_WESOR|nr:amidase [Westerdykella ornata]KAF2274216.1 amidase [Westerdykella ornata]
MTPTWLNQASTKRGETLNKIPASWHLPEGSTSHITEDSTDSVLYIPAASGILTERELQITERHDATNLVTMMRSRVYTCEEVVTAFCKRAAIAHQVVNCLTEIMFEEAIEKAKVCDEMVESGAELGPLHGLPISLKDSFNVKGVQTTIGYISFLSHPPAASNSHLVDILIANGAIPFCKTNLPQTMMSADTHNNVFGRTLNPNNPSLTAGGSSGGEGALLKMRGSVLGVATDIAGSNRIPALCNGVKSFKPTASRIPFGNKVPPGRLGSPSSILPVIGPMGHSVRDLELFMRSVIDTRPWIWDENVLDVPWRRVHALGSHAKLRFGVMGSDPQRPLHPPVARTMYTALEVLKAADHEIIEITGYPSLWSTAVLAWKYFLLDPERTPAKHVHAGAEPWVPSIAVTKFPELEGWEPSIEGLFQMNVARAKVLKFYHDVFVKEALDAIVMPGYQATAVPHDTYGVPIYTVLQNLLNVGHQVPRSKSCLVGEKRLTERQYPSGILPFLRAEQRLDEAYVQTTLTYEPPYDAQRIEGAPCAIQVMGRPMRDEELIEVMKVVERLLEEYEKEHD